MLADPLPRRWAHSQGVARKARTLAPILGDNAELMEASAILHDVGYSPSIASTGFHPLDGARFLRDQEHADERLIRIVAHHSCALLEADLRGLRHELETEFALESPDLVDAMIYCDMTTTPHGEPTDVDQRLTEIASRYGPEHLVTAFIQQAGPEIRAAAERVLERLESTPQPM
ncbi:HD domain-containing protein [Streptomyces sp. NPDC101150]|uniref:HD domain-containing protein n=1 Tax=Streptomyces sp. NPDC101150 TaxID=3366114 RepID=UPI00380FAB55